MAHPQPMRFENLEQRINTFRCWPPSAPLSAGRIARAGFYYTGTGTEVECFACKKRISDWNCNDQAIARHLNLSPDCPFLKQKNRISRPQPPRSLRTLSTGSTSSTGSSDSDSQPPSPLENIRLLSMSSSRPLLSQEERRALKREDVRLMTFNGRWTKDFIDTRELAKAGFFFVGHGDQVQCAFCAGVVGHWEEGDVPMEEHRRHFEICPFVRGCDVGNIPAEATNGSEAPLLSLPPAVPGGYDICERYIRSRSRQLAVDNLSPRSGGIALPSINSQPLVTSVHSHLNSLANLRINAHRGPEHPDKTTFEARLKTFANWRYHERMDPRKLAEAGFFYLGESDKVKCFHCDMGLCNWEVTDDPWVEHARWFSDCVFLIQSKGDEFIKEVKESLKKKAQMAMEVVEATKVRQAILNQLKRTGQGFTAVDALIIAALEIPDQPVETSSSVPSSNGTETSLSRDVSEILQELGESALQEQEASEPTNLQQLPEEPAISAYPRSNAEIGEDVSPPWYGTPAPERNEIPPGEPPVISNVVSPRRSLEEAMDVDIQDKFEEAIEERYKCKVCLDKRIEVIFLPCGHLASCSSCTSALANCPLCRQVIGGTAKAFLP
ncbi:putative inhibitor of apoptosis isoform X2 [Artemia franciscana]|uniref:putative inhibitor of apoptosis isoform X2 n=1 Tax=Artemia franciscana TaxID=6661 RepID=UPI0032DA50E6